VYDEVVALEHLAGRGVDVLEEEDFVLVHRISLRERGVHRSSASTMR
jgi:hypothetical protein